MENECNEWYFPDGSQDNCLWQNVSFEEDGTVVLRIPKDVFFELCELLEGKIEH